MKSWLLGSFPNDILMPVDKGAKHPKYSHRSGEWTWERFIAEGVLMDEMDVCVLLRELCVVDVDSEEQALQLEQRFPVLADVPSERTSRGRHYWFIRPDVADTLGYYDGGGQRERGVDFKSVCATGTSGIILVAPSSNKSWIRAPWNCETLKEMPLELLDAVAVPTRVQHDMMLRFVGSNERMHYVGRGVLNKLAYFEPFLSGDLDSDTASVPVPCTGAEFEILLQALAEVPFGTPPTLSLLQRLCRTADLLGLDRRTADKMLTRGKMIEWFDIHAMSADMWRARSAEEHAVSSGNSSSIVVRVDNVLARQLTYTPIDKQGSSLTWLFPNGDRVHVDAGTPVLHPNPSQYLCGSIHPLVFQILMRFNGHVVLAGGSVVGAVASLVESWHDYDLFFHGIDDVAVADRLLGDIIAMAKPKVIHRSPAATTIFLSDETMIQVIHTLYRDSADVIITFDVAPCKMLARCDESGTLIVEAMPTCCEALRHMAFVADFGKWSTSSVPRLLKYMTRGFEVMLPGIRREALLQNHNNIGVARLFAFEKQVERRRVFTPMYLTDVRDRLSMDEVKQILMGLLPSSDYEDMSLMQGRLMHVLRSMANRMCGRRRAPVQEPPVPWLLCNIALNKNCARRPSDPGLRHLHDVTKLMMINQNILS